MFDTVTAATKSAIDAITRHGYYDRSAWITVEGKRKPRYNFFFATNEVEANEYHERVERNEVKKSRIICSVNGANYDPSEVAA